MLNLNPLAKCRYKTSIVAMKHRCLYIFQKHRCIDVSIDVSPPLTGTPLRQRKLWISREISSNVSRPQIVRLIVWKSTGSCRLGQVMFVSGLWGVSGWRPSPTSDPVAIWTTAAASLCWESCAVCFSGEIGFSNCSATRQLGIGGANKTVGLHFRTG